MIITFESNKGVVFWIKCILIYFLISIEKEKNCWFIFVRYHNYTNLEVDKFNKLNNILWKLLYINYFCVIIRAPQICGIIICGYVCENSQNMMLYALKSTQSMTLYSDFHFSGNFFSGFVYLAHYFFPKIY